MLSVATKYEVVKAEPWHYEFVAAFMREDDVAEVWASSHRSPEEALKLSALASRDTARAGLVDGIPACVFGVGQATILSLKGSPWLLGTDELPKHARAFLRMSKAYVERIRQEYHLLENYVDARNKHAIRWLKWLGFEFEEAKPFGPDRVPFHRFFMVKANV